SGSRPALEDRRDGVHASRAQARSPRAADAPGAAAPLATDASATLGSRAPSAPVSGHRIRWLAGAAVLPTGALVAGWLARRAPTESGPEAAPGSAAPVAAAPSALTFPDAAPIEDREASTGRAAPSEAIAPRPATSRSVTTPVRASTSAERPAPIATAGVS